MSRWILEEAHDVLVAPHRPGMRAIVHLGLVAPPFEGLVEVAGEVAGVAGAGAAQGLDVVQRVVGVLRAGQRLQLAGSRCASPRAPRCPGRRGTRKSDRRWCASSGLGDRVGRRDVGDRGAVPRRPIPTERDHGRVPVQQDAEGVLARRDIALPAMTFSPIANLSNEAIVPGAMIGTLPDATSAVVDHALDTAVVVDVGVRVDDRRDRLVDHVLAEQRHALRGRPMPVVQSMTIRPSSPSTIVRLARSLFRTW